MNNTEETKKILGSIFFCICLMMTILSASIFFINYTTGQYDKQIQNKKKYSLWTTRISKEDTKQEKNLNDNLWDVFE